MESKSEQKSIWQGRGLGGCVGDAGGQHGAYYVRVRGQISQERMAVGHVERPGAVVSLAGFPAGPCVAVVRC